MGVSFDSILDKVHNSVGNQLERTHLITKKDLYNIETSFKLRGDQRHKDDATSVRMWIEELKSQDSSNPVLLYKPQGQIEAIIGHSVGLGMHTRFCDCHSNPFSNPITSRNVAGLW